MRSCKTDENDPIMDRILGQTELVLGSVLRIEVSDTVGCVAGPVLRGLAGLRYQATPDLTSVGRLPSQRDRSQHRSAASRAMSQDLSRISPCDVTSIVTPSTQDMFGASNVSVSLSCTKACPNVPVQLSERLTDSQGRGFRSMSVSFIARKSILSVRYT